jgi:hypothetical protein
MPRKTRYPLVAGTPASFGNLRGSIWWAALSSFLRCFWMRNKDGGTLSVYRIDCNQHGVDVWKEGGILAFAMRQLVNFACRREDRATQQCDLSARRSAIRHGAGRDIRPALFHPYASLHAGCSQCDKLTKSPRPHSLFRVNAGIVEGLNPRLPVRLGKAFGVRTIKPAGIAMYHQLGHLPGSKLPHKSC